jgi:uncharacterized Rossmann fold enzyme
VEFARWAPQYERIRRDFQFDLARERASADALLALLPEGARDDPLPRIAPRLEGRDVVVVGLAPRAGAPPVWSLPGSERPAIVAADGAAARCLDAGLVPEVITTDLDGPVPSEVLANARGALVVLHAHGDNRPAVERWAPEFAGEVAGSWAGPPEPGLLDVGGFTDGDRGAYLAQHLGARRVLLWGFDAERVEEPASERPMKLRKLAWTRELLKLLAGGPTPVIEWRPDGTQVPYPGTGAEPSTQ